MIYLIFAQPPCFRGWISIYIHLPTILARYTGDIHDVPHFWKSQKCPHRLNDVFLASRAPGTSRDPEAGQELQYWPLRAKLSCKNISLPLFYQQVSQKDQKRRAQDRGCLYDGEGLRLTFIVGKCVHQIFTVSTRLQDLGTSHVWYINHVPSHFDGSFRHFWWLLFHFWWFKQYFWRFKSHLFVVLLSKSHKLSGPIPICAPVTSSRSRYASDLAGAPGQWALRFFWGGRFRNSRSGISKIMTPVKVLRSSPRWLPWTWGFQPALRHIQAMQSLMPKKDPEKAVGIMVSGNCHCGISSKSLGTCHQPDELRVINHFYICLEFTS